jgi:hypothetical protein
MACDPWPGKRNAIGPFVFVIVDARQRPGT